MGTRDDLPHPVSPVMIVTRCEATRLRISKWKPSAGSSSGGSAGRLWVDVVRPAAVLLATVPKGELASPPSAREQAPWARPEGLLVGVEEEGVTAAAAVEAEVEAVVAVAAPGSSPEKARS